MQRDCGSRDDRHRARLKYTIEERGIDWIRAEVARRARVEIPPLAEQAPWSDEDYHGTRDGVVGLPGAVGQDRRPRRRRSCARRCASWSPTASSRDHASPARQDLLLHGIADGRTDQVEDRLRAPRRQAGRRRRARCAACRSPARPCRRAARRWARPSGCCPTSSTELEKALADSGNGDEPIRLNMTGCPNGCARPYNSRDRHRRADQEGLRHLRRRLGGRRPAWASASAPTCRSTRSPPRWRRCSPSTPARTDKATTFGDWSRRGRHRDDRHVAARAGRPAPGRAAATDAEDAVTVGRAGRRRARVTPSC